MKNVPDNYEQYFVPAIGEPLAKELIRRAHPGPGDRVLDVACGTGIVARLALQQVGAEGTVTGLDINPGMLAVARSLNSSVEWHQANAEAIPLPDEAFDVVICQLSLQFMDDKPAALEEMRRVLAPGGRIFLNLPGPAGPPFADLADAMERIVSPEAAGFVKQVFSLYDPSEIRQLMSDAGFREVEVQAKEIKFSLPAPKDFLWQYVHGTPLAGTISEADGEIYSALEREVTEEWQQYVEDGAFRYRQRIVTASARK